MALTETVPFTVPGKRVLIVDDEPGICRALRQLLEQRGCDVLVAANASEALRQGEQGDLDLVIVDVRLPDGDGIQVLEQIRAAKRKDVAAIVITAFGDLDTAARALGTGAIEYLPKPFSLSDIDSAVARALRRVETSSPTTRSLDSPEVPLLGRSVPMQRVFKQIALAATSDLPVLITGESGTGKELVAQAIHVYSRRSGPFVPVCLPALNPNLIESELFGHRRGAFTGAITDRPGYFQHAEQGTVFLDEISEIPVGLQAKLLRVLESRTFSPVGSVEVRSVRARIVAATNRRLKNLVKRGQFRADLYYRLSAIHIHVPPLSRRKEDIPLLAEYFLQQYAARVNTELHFGEETVRELKRRQWPGNVRQLRFAVEYAAVRARQGLVLPEHLPPDRGGASGARPVNAQRLYRLARRLGRSLAEQLLESGEDATGELYEKFGGYLERAFIRGVVDACNGNLSLAARLLGLHRATVRKKLRGE